MSLFTSAVIPLILTLTAVHGMIKRVDVFDALITGAKEGLAALVKIVPSLVALLCAIQMFRASGAMDFLTGLLTPVLSYAGIPGEVLPLMAIRPLSGSGALAVASDIIAAAGADSFVGRTAAVMLGSTETTFYTIAVYFGAAKVKGTRHAIPAALVADLVGFLAAAASVRLFFGG